VRAGETAEGTEAPVQGRSGFDIALAMFRKRRMAVAAAAILVVFFYSAIWAPLLATSAPLHFRGYDRGAATQAARIGRLEVLDLVGALDGKGRWTRESVEGSFRVVDFQLDRMEGSLKDDLGAVVKGLRREIEGLRKRWSAGVSSDPWTPEVANPREARALEVLAARMESSLHPTEADLLVRSRWPALRGLEPLDIFFMVLSISVVGALPLLRSGAGHRRRPRAWLVWSLVPAVVAAPGWYVLANPRPDTTDYKGGIRDGTIAAESVTYAPVPFGVNDNDLDRLLEGPAERDGVHLLGTDQNGRDMLSRMLWGSRVSLSVGFVAVGIYVFIGVVIGSVAGFFGGWVDIVISRFIEWVICFPVFFLILVIVAFLQERTVFGFDPPQIYVIMLVIGVTGWTTVARLVRAEFLKLVGQDFVVAARALGARDRNLIFRHVLPNAMAPVLVAAAFGVAGAILTESALSFLGLGISVPRPSWGGMLDSAHGYEPRSAWIFLWPGLAIFLVITCYNLVGEALRDALDPRLRQ
jgi:peptide/nickel transport system permease protein